MMRLISASKARMVPAFQNFAAGAKKRFMSDGVSLEEKYSPALSWMHWAIAAGAIGCIGTV